MGEWELSWGQDPCLLDGLVLLMRGTTCATNKDVFEMQGGSHHRCVQDLH